MFRLTFRILIISAFVALTSQCSNIRASSDFGERQDNGVIEFDAIREASGIVASRNNPGVLWVHNDSGKRALYAINTRGEHLGVYKISGCNTKDWEDITIGASERSGERLYLYWSDWRQSPGNVNFEASAVLQNQKWMRNRSPRKSELQSMHGSTLDTQTVDALMQNR